MRMESHQTRLHLKNKDSKRQKNPSLLGKTAWQTPTPARDFHFSVPIIKISLFSPFPSFTNGKEETA
jgi:hypothetical protein